MFFIFPIGHERETVRRLPWVTIAIIVANIAIFVGVGLGGGRAERRFAERLSAAMKYWSEHPYLAVPPSLTSDHLTPQDRKQLNLMREAFKHIAPQDPSELRRQQDELNRLAAVAVAVQREHPLLQWGLVPRHPTPSAFLKSMFMHAGWLHLLTNMFFLFLVGPAVEDAYGRPLFAALYLGGGVVASLVHIAAFPASEAPLVGASGAIAVTMGAFMVRFARARMRFFYWVFYILRGTFSAPAWLMLALWLLQQIFFASMTAASGAGVAYFAHAGGFIFGALVALGIKASGVEERHIHPAIERQISVSQHPALDEGMELLARGDLVAAREALGRALADEPRNRDVHLALWQTFLAEGVPFDHWRELKHDTGHGGPGVLRWRLAAALADANPEGEAQVLRDLAGDPGAELLQEKAQRRLQSLGLATGAERAAAPEGAPAPTAQTASPGQPVPTTAAQRTPTPGDAPPAFFPPPLPTGLEVEVASPEAQQPEGLLLRGGPMGVELAPYTQIEAVAVAGIGGGEKPYLVIDLILPGETGRGRRALRLMSTTFDPRQVTGRPDLPPMSALRLMISNIVRGSGAKVLTGDEGLAGGRFPMFPSIEDYEKHILSSYT
jgi:membrane associated rhomboid family serine protease